MLTRNPTFHQFPPSPLPLYSSPHRTFHRRRYLTPRFSPNDSRPDDLSICDVRFSGSKEKKKRIAIGGSSYRKRRTRSLSESRRRTPLFHSLIPRVLQGSRESKERMHSSQLDRIATKRRTREIIDRLSINSLGISAAALEKSFRCSGNYIRSLLLTNYSRSSFTCFLHHL